MRKFESYILTRELKIMFKLINFLKYIVKESNFYRLYLFICNTRTYVIASLTFNNNNNNINLIKLQNLRTFMCRVI